MSKPKYTYRNDGQTEIADYGDYVVVRARGRCIPRNPLPTTTPEVPKPPLPRELLRQQLGLDTIGQPNGKKS
jgi:hypothetical protein